MGWTKQSRPQDEWNNSPKTGWFATPWFYGWFSAGWSKVVNIIKEWSKR